MRTTIKTVRHLPLNAFLTHAKVSGHRQPDPVPTALMFAAVLFSLSAFLMMV